MQTKHDILRTFYIFFKLYYFQQTTGDSTETCALGETVSRIEEWSPISGFVTLEDFEEPEIGVFPTEVNNIDIFLF